MRFQALSAPGAGFPSIGEYIVARAHKNRRLEQLSISKSSSKVETI